MNKNDTDKIVLVKSIDVWVNVYFLCVQSSALVTVVSEEKVEHRNK